VDFALRDDSFPLKCRTQHTTSFASASLPSSFESGKLWLQEQLESTAPVDDSSFFLFFSSHGARLGCWVTASTSGARWVYDESMRLFFFLMEDLFLIGGSALPLLS
jgi:hypothetical protein